METLSEVQTFLEGKVEEIREHIIEHIQQKGNVEDACQRVCLLNALATFERSVAGLEPSDLKENSRGNVK